MGSPKFPKIYGLNECSEVGEDIFALSIFLGNCNLRCPYCMNAKLINPNSHNLKSIDIETVKKSVKENKSEWVIISGGEPTCTPVLLLTNLITEIKSWGCKVGLSTNGTNSGVLKQIIVYLNYVALDIKSPNNRDYDSISNGDSKKFDVLISKSLLAENKSKRKDLDYEIRSTLFPPFINKSNIREIGSIMRKSDRWILQQFRHSKNMLDKKSLNVKPYTEKEIEEIVRVAMEFSDNVLLKEV